MKSIIVVLIALCVYTECRAQDTKDLNIDYMLRGQIYAASSITDSTALGGFAKFGAQPKKLSKKIGETQEGVYLWIDTTKHVVLNEEINGFKLYIVNKSDSVARFVASDSRLYVVAEVYYENSWKPIEYLPSSTCGNSYHTVYLKENDYWEFHVPKFNGNLKVKMRYKLMYYGGNDVYSNIIEARVNKAQMLTKQGHSPNGIMDPYND